MLAAEADHMRCMYERMVDGWTFSGYKMLATVRQPLAVALHNSHTSKKWDLVTLMWQGAERQWCDHCRR
jgi:hypothetical protein